MRQSCLGKEERTSPPEGLMSTTLGSNFWLAGKEHEERKQFARCPLRDSVLEPSPGGSGGETPCATVVPPQCRLGFRKDFDRNSTGTKCMVLQVHGLGARGPHVTELLECACTRRLWSIQVWRRASNRSTK